MLSLHNVSKTFSGNFYPVLNQISLNFDAKQFCIIIGSNGSGKSTLLRTISGEHEPDQGQIMIHGKVMKDKSQLVASVIQDVNQGTIPQMSLLENIVLGTLKHQRAKLIPYAHHQAQAIEHIRSLNMNLERYIDTPLQHLSGGQRQMIATLMAIKSNPQILLLDEHTSALDPKTQHTLMSYTANAIKTQGILTLMVTHKLEDALHYGDRLIMLHQGRVVLDVQDEEKQALTAKTLLDLFHKYEDLSLMA